MPEIGWAGLGIVPEVGSDFGRTLTRGVDPSLSQVGRDSGKRFGGILGKAAAVTVAGAIGAGFAAFKFGSGAVDLAADLEQSIGAVDTVFKKSAGQMHGWAKTAANDVGLTRNQFNELGSVIGTQLRNGGTAMKQLGPKTKNLITLGADLASMFGGETSEAVEALSSALKGERDPIERYGVSLNDASIKAEALSKGIVKAKVDSFDLKQSTLKMTIAQANYNKAVGEHGKNSIEAAKAEATLGAATKKFNEVSEGKVDELTAQQKQTATLSLIYKQTTDAQGNFGRESDTLSGKQQRLKASLEDTKTEIGTALLPVISDAAGFLLKEGVPAFQKFADWFSDKGAPAIAGFIDDMKPIAEELLPAIGGAIDDIGGFLKDAAPHAKDLVEAFNNAPDWVKKGTAFAGLALLAKSKLPKGGLFGKGGAAGALGSARGATAATPMYVWVVNGGAGVGGKGGKGPLGIGTTSALLAIAGGTVVADNGPKILSGLKGPEQAADASVAAIQKALEKSDLGKYAADIGINIEALATGIATQGEQSKEFQDAVKKLEKTNSGAWEDINDLIPVVGTWITTSGDHAAWALKDLRSIVEGASREVRNQHNLDMLDLLKANDKPGNPFANAFGLPNKKGKNGKNTLDAEMTLLFTPEAKETKAGVAKLLEDVGDLDRRPYDLKFNALGLRRAKNDAQILLETLLKIADRIPSAIGGPTGLNPFDGPARTSSRSPRLSVDNVTINATNADRLISDLTDIQRRASIGGFG